MQIETAKRLHDALAAAQEIRDIAGTCGAPSDESRRVRQLAIERLLSTIGEALNRAIQLERAVQRSIPDAPLIIGMRNRIIHGYDDIRGDIVWDVVQNHIPALITRLEELLADAPPLPD